MSVAAYFPAFLDLRGRHCLVVGGGPVAERKARVLLECGAEVLVVSPVVTGPLAALAARGRLIHRPRAFRRHDVAGCRVVIAATGRAAVDRDVVRIARGRGALVNAVDRPALCDFIVPSVLTRGPLKIAVSTGGRSPALAREIRRRLEGVIGPEYGELVERVGRRRAAARARAGSDRERLAAGEWVVADALRRFNGVS